MKKTFKIGDTEIRKINEEIERVSRRIKEDRELRRLILKGLTYAAIDVRKALRKGAGPEVKIRKSERFRKIEEKLDSILNKENTNPRWGFITMYTGCGVFWWYLINGTESGCKYQSVPEPIDDTDKCDIHYEPIFWLHSEGRWVEGLINIAGREFANNCGGNCGIANSRKEGACMHHPEDYPELYWENTFIYAYYTSTDKGGCWNVHKPAGCEFDFRGQESQHMVLDYYLSI